MITVNTRRFYIEQVSGVTVACFTVSTIVDPTYEFVSDELFDLVEYLASNEPIQVVLDLWSVRKIDDWGLAMLRAFHETITSQGGMVILCRIPLAISNALTEAGLADGFHIRDTRHEAIATFRD